MRPLYLSVEGLNSFSDRQEIDFSDAADGNIFCICGPTGSGKSTILDAMIISLYGKSARGTKEDCINLSCTKAEIVFRFEFGGETWEVRRVLSRKSGGDRAFLTRLSPSEKSSDGVEKVNAELQKLIGLSREDFTQVVILEQGKFGKFLSAKKTERNKTIAQLFSLDRFDGLSQKFGAAEKKFESLEKECAARQEHLAHISPAYIKEKKAELKKAEAERKSTDELLKKLEKEVAEIESKRRKFADAAAAKKGLAEVRAAAEGEKLIGERLEKTAAELAEAEKAAETAKQNRDEAKEILSKIDIARAKKDTVEKLKGERLELVSKYKESEAAMTDAENKAAAEREKKRETLGKFSALFAGVGLTDTAELSVYFNERKSELGSAVAADEISAANYAAAADKLADAERKFALCNAGIPQIEERFGAAEKAETAAKKEYEKQSLENMAHAVASGLKDGDVCPVCGGAFCRGAHAGAEKCAADLDGLKRLADEASALREKCAAELKLVFAERDRLLQETALLRGDAEKALKNIKCTQDPKSIDSALKKAKSEFSEICAAVEALGIATQSDKIISEYEKKRDKCKAEKELIEQQGKSKVEEIKTHEAELFALVGGDFVSAEKAAKEKLENAEKTINGFSAAKEEYSKAHAEHRANEAKYEAQTAQFEKTLLSLGDIEFDEDSAAETERRRVGTQTRRDELIALSSELKSETERAEKGLEDKAKTEKERRYYEKKRDTAKTLASLMRGNKFLEYIEEEYIREFTFRASEKLFELSGGKYNLEYIEDEKDSDFWVCDHLRGGEKRKVKTLSGGETFLASLSMAIAISEQISKNKSYDFFFLDEGFGTLDENALDTVASALYKLASQTMVGLVSHRSELVEKIPSRIKISPATELQGSMIRVEKA